MLELEDESCLRFRKQQKNVPEKEHSIADAHDNVLLANHKLLQKWVGDKIKRAQGTGRRQFSQLVRICSIIRSSE